jgi:N-acyl-D-aspartate/D-glutamate deacylase
MLVCLVLTAAAALAQQPEYDVVIRGGQIVDGTGAARVAGDVAISGGRVVAVGRVPEGRGRRVIDARGLIVAPGFIDLHTHSDLPLVADGSAQSKVRQGVTLDVLGESTSVAPRDGLKDQPASDAGVSAENPVKQDWTTFTGYFDRIERQGVSINVISHVSAEQVRLVVKGYDEGRPPQRSSSA